jgi:hypothetical protein
MNYKENDALYSKNFVIISELLFLIQPDLDLSAESGSIIFTPDTDPDPGLEIYMRRIRI